MQDENGCWTLPSYETPAYQHSSRIVVTDYCNGQRFSIYVLIEGYGWRQVAQALYGMKSVQKFSKRSTHIEMFEDWCNKVVDDRLEKRLERIAELEFEVSQLKSEVEAYESVKGN